MTEVFHRSPALRVHWRERQTVRSADLAGEQSYRLDARHRHARGQHRPGVISGLRVVAEPGGLAVTPGAAIDGFGRYVLLRRPQSLAIETLAEAHDHFGLEGEGEMVISISQALEPLSRSGSSDRRIEGCQIRLAPAAVFDRAPAHESPDGDSGDSPVPLASIVFAQGAGVVHFDRRVVAGSVAQEVRDPLGRAHLSLHDEPHTQRVAVSLAEPSDTGNGPAVERLRIDRDLATTINGRASVRGRVRLAEKGGGQGLTTSQRLHFLPVAQTPEDARAWSFYRTDLERMDDAGERIGPPVRQLRIEASGPNEDAGRAETDGDPKGFLFAVGRRVETSFVPCLKVDSECTVTVGDLRVEGQVTEGPIPADPNDPRYAEAAAESYLSGIGAALDPFAELGLESTNVTDVPLAGVPLGFETTLRNLGPVAIAALSVTASLHDEQQNLQTIDLHEADLFPTNGTLDLKGEFDPVGTGTYTLVISASGVTSGHTPVTISDVVEVEVFPIPG